MQPNKWPSIQPEAMTSYVPLPYYNNGEYPSNDPSSGSEASSQLPVSSPLQPGILSMSQPETPRPESPSSLPPVPSNASLPNNKMIGQPSMPSRSSSYTTTFHSIPYSNPGPIRRRRTDSFFSFETGPTFTETRQHYDLCSLDQTNNFQVHLYAKMDRGFFRADQDWTCYRRNYFQVSSVFEIQGTNYELRGPEVPCLLRKPDIQEWLQVEYFSIGISARIASNDKKIEIVQHTPKRDKGPQIIPEPRIVRAGGNLHLASVGANHNIVTFERLQFKTATANNGKRRAAQQYYEIVIDLYANFSNQPPLCVASCSSAPLVVRGRSPGHYADSHTRFRHNNHEDIDSQRPPQSIPMAPDVSNSTHSTLDNNEQSSPNTSTHYSSIPNSPISDFGPYPGYQGYPYPSLSTGYSSMMSSQPMSQYPSSQPNPSHFQHHALPPPAPPTPSSHMYHNYQFNGSKVSKQDTEKMNTDYWSSPQHDPRIHHEAPHYPAGNHMYMASYQSRLHQQEDNHSGFSGIDAGRS